ncbi:MAG: FecR domain-containing protein, partial [Opitutaceae bacterium]|nr:FecR domain-containing protein [Verrucomicrobiales bacterium]
GQTAVKTGIQSRSELVFHDKTVTRLGANTLFSFTQGTRNMTLKEGTLLLQVPPDAGGAKITTGAVTAAITGSTVMCSLSKDFLKIIVIESKHGVRVFLNNKPLESFLVFSGEMAILRVDAKSVKEERSVPINIKTLVNTSALIQGLSFNGTPFTLDPIQPVIVSQQDNKDLTPTNLVILGSGIDVLMATDYITNADGTLELALNTSNDNSQSGQSGSSSDNGSGSGSSSDPKTGPAPVFAGTFVVDSSTTIVTDPIISNASQSHTGRIFRLNTTTPIEEIAGFLFGGMGLFDARALGDGPDSETPPAFAVFKFENLVLTGGPTIHTAGGPDAVALIAQNSITSGGPGGNVSLSLLNALILWTVNGPISIGPEISFSGVGDDSGLSLYARGPGSDLTFGSMVNLPSTGTSLELLAENDIFYSGQFDGADFIQKSGNNFTGSGGASINAHDLEFEMANASLSQAGSTLQLNGVAINAPAIDGDEFDLRTGTLTLTSDINLLDQDVDTFFVVGTGGVHASGFNLGVLDGLSVAGGDVTVRNLETGELTIANGSLNASGRVSDGFEGSEFESVDLLSVSQNITVGGELRAQEIEAGGNITVGGELRFEEINIGGSISAFVINGDILTAGGNVVATGVFPILTTFPRQRLTKCARSTRPRASFQNRERGC